MKSAFLQGAERDDVAHAVRRVLEGYGALVYQHQHARVRFKHEPPGLSWTRQGYVGIYQRLGEREVEARLVLRARWPYRLLLAVAAANVIAVVVTAILNPDGTTWSVVAGLGGFALLAAAIVYVQTLRRVRADEDALMQKLWIELAKSVPMESIETASDREVRLMEQAIEGAVAEQQVRAEAKSAPKPQKAAKAPRSPDAPKPKRSFGFSLRPGKKPSEPEPVEAVAVEAEAAEAEPEESLEEKRARLLARKAELESRRNE